MQLCQDNSRKCDHWSFNQHGQPAERQFVHIYRRSDKSDTHELARDRVMDTFNNISVISWQSVLLVEETGVPGENHRPAASHWQILSLNVVLSTPRLSGIRTHNVSVIGTNSIGSCKPNYHTITIPITTASTYIGNVWSAHYILKTIVSSI